MSALPVGAQVSFLASPLLRMRIVEAIGVHKRKPAIAGQIQEDVIGDLVLVGSSPLCSTSTGG